MVKIKFRSPKLSKACIFVPTFIQGMYLLCLPLSRAFICCAYLYPGHAFAVLTFIQGMYLLYSPLSRACICCAYLYPGHVFAVVLLLIFQIGGAVGVVVGVAHHASGVDLAGSAVVVLPGLVRPQGLRAHLPARLTLRATQPPQTCRAKHEL